MNRTLSLLLLPTALAAAACRDLDYPEGDEAVNEPPVVEFLLPAAGEISPISPVVSLDVRDPNGIASVRLLCGGVPVYVWTAPPFLASVDLGQCPGTTDASTGRRTVTLQAVASDVPGLESDPASRSIVLDVAMAQLQVSGASRAAPRGRYLLRITSDRSLGAVPSARIGSLAAQVSQRTDLETSPLTVFDAVFEQMPGLGVDLLDGGTPTQAQLEETERTYVVEVEGRASSGNVTRVVQAVTVSRIAWSRALPLSYDGVEVGDSDREDPVVTPQGLVMTFPVGSVQKLPGTLSHAEGAYLPFQGDLRDGGYTFQGLDAEGRALFSQSVSDGGSGFDLLHTSATGELLGETTVDALPEDPLRRVGSSLCGSFTADAGTCFTGAPSAVRALRCFSPGEASLGPTVPDRNEVARFNGGGWAVSGDTYAAYGFSGGVCADDLAIFLANPVTSTGALVTPTTAMESSAIERVIPLGSDRFLIAYFNYATGRAVTEVIESGGAPGGRFFTDAALTHLGRDPAFGLPASYLFAAQQATPPRVITRRTRALETVFEAWEQNATSPVHSFVLPGFHTSTFSDSSRPGQVYTDADGSMYLQLVVSSTSTPSVGSGSTPKPSGRDVLVALDPQLRPRWIHRFDSNVSGWLYAGGPDSHLYFVDEANQRVTAFNR